jgi:hypothetical protein
MPGGERAANERTAVAQLASRSAYEVLRQRLNRHRGIEPCSRAKAGLLIRRHGGQ